jgi:hypothetical protein
MHKQTVHKELYDPFTHYSRGALFFDQKTFKFVAYRMPYLELDNKTWETEQAFKADYQRVVERRYGRMD